MQIQYTKNLNPGRFDLGTTLSLLITVGLFNKLADHVHLAVSRGFKPDKTLLLIYETALKRHCIIIIIIIIPCKSEIFPTAFFYCFVIFFAAFSTMQ